MLKGIALLALLTVTNVQAGVYKCEMPNGRISYQSMPCPSTAKSVIKTDLPQRAEMQPVTEVESSEVEAESIEGVDAESEKPKTWLEKRAEEREAKKEARKADHDQRVDAASQRIEFERLIFNRQIAIGMSREQVLKALGEPSKSKSKQTVEGKIEELSFKRYIGSTYTGSDEVVLTNGLVTEFSMDECDSRRCR